MLHVFVGSDTIAVRQKVSAFLEKHEGDTVRISTENYVPGMLEDLVHAQSMFTATQELVLCDTLSENEDALIEIETLLAEMGEATRIFVLLENTIKSAFEKKLKAHTQSYNVLDSHEKKEVFNTFSFADAFLRKDKKSLWVLLQRAKMAGVPPEEIAGVLFWQLKSLRLAYRTKSAAEAGMKDYPYRKAQGARKDFTQSEVEILSRELLTLYHRGHAESDMELLLEQFVLAFK